VNCDEKLCNIEINSKAANKALRIDFLNTGLVRLHTRDGRQFHAFAPKHEERIPLLRPSSDVVLLPCRFKLLLGSTVARQENNFDSDVVTESNQIQD